ncbi:protein kinase domain-containing protein [Mycobacterium mantenii]|uniref:non-specific serine/threonine protein kinase n=1 Tax=Mycobacterium mantenii TaxID=560555 RepID=A0A1A2SUA1_MYCNT|nr:protein kinase [Mycobacterium mantenii]OBH47789.1 protein kinase [Mycobacterium mantenii]OBH67690.1 protein kinase [Mycobacterium mantenii]
MNLDPDSFGHYRILELLGRGGMGRVYRAYDATTDRVVALKVLPPHLAEDQDFQQRFRREARIAAGLNDPHVVPIHGYGELDGRLYVDMRLIEGRDLSHYIKENGDRLSPEQTVAVIEQVAAALDSAHHAGLIHRDIKPMNILITTAHNFVYLIDFGLARAEADTQLTQTGATMGTVAYMAPERFKGKTDHRADVYSLACVLHECLTGKRPFAGESLEEQLNAHLNAPPPRTSATAPGVPPGFDAVVARGMAKDPEQRYQTAMELAAAARAVLAADGMGATSSASPPPGPAVPPPGGKPDAQQHRPTHSRRLLAGIFGASALALAAVAVLVIALVTQSHGSADSAASSTQTRARVPGRTGSNPGTSDPASATAPPLPAFAPPPDLGANCQYRSVPDPAARSVNPPPAGRVSTIPPQIGAVISTNLGDIAIQLANSESPCAVNSFVSLARQQFFDNTQCARLINSQDGGSLLCGGPDVDGSGGPGYEFADEYPADQYKPDDPALRATVVYPRGTIVMATEGANTNGSQFALIFKDSEMEPQSTVLGTIDQAGLETLDKIARAGIAGNRQSGAPTNPVKVTAVRLS